MPLRSPGWRIASRFAALVLILAGFSGCRWLPSRHPVPSIDPRAVSQPGSQAPQALPLEGTDSTAMHAQVPLPPLPLMPVSDAEALAAAPAPETPRLDEALKRAHAINHAFVNGLQDDQKPPTPPPLIAPLPVPKPKPTGPVVPPRLEKVPDPQPEARLDESVKPASSTRVSAPSAPVPAPPETWDEALNRLLRLAREHARTETEPGVWTAREQLLQRLVDAEKHDDENDGEPSLWESVMTSLAEAEQAPTPVPQTPEPPALSVADLRLCRQVSGFGRYEPAPDEDITTGKELMLYWEVQGFEPKPEGDLYLTRLATELAILPQDSDDPVWSRAFNDPDDACRRPRRDYFVNYQLTIPESLPTGSYRVRLRLKDRHSGQTAERELVFHLAS